ncbi:CoA pyrophosphatase [Lysobacter lacus]|uniref:CoA pyrophosphatase n=1 Tax=Cognatilysobacter lacus TaxID=1643323 RepID=A0A5D8YW85_9GAMM|nr:CoA pyrophosphatase [Lysobacter lacus]
MRCTPGRRRAAMSDALVARLRRALHPLDAPPCGACWNASELEDLVDLSTLLDAAVLVGLVPRADGLQVLLTRRSDGLRQHGGQVSFPGGRVDAGDVDALHAALRETREEVGIPAALLAPLGYLQPLATVTGFRVLPVVALVDPAYVATPDPAEVAEVFEVPLAFLLDPTSRSERRFEHEGRARRVWEYRYPDQRIWGATASMLLNLHDRLEAAG